ncbi:unnamed protein product [Periconia digitata]|uniref:CENP-V/GFA domain-containing protein n=1 Tax=Periconia digitata TaxID=1303443 RepID=A0A9W4XMA1_9PLEO|nr:unnamed protein product [Periconia digitata]
MNLDRRTANVQYPLVHSASANSSSQAVSTPSSPVYTLYLPSHPIFLSTRIIAIACHHILLSVKISGIATKRLLTAYQYRASCHCGLIQYSVVLSPPLHDIQSWVVECNCSICARNGYLNVYVQNECIQFDNVGLESELVEKYRFGRQRVQHYFCSRCGSSLMAESIEPGFYEGVKALNVCSTLCQPPYHV